VRYRGVNKNGVAISGQQTGNPMELVADYFRRGFRSLTVTDSKGDQMLGQIYRHLDTGHRAWWAVNAEDG
jgi:hypothetical protein